MGDIASGAVPHRPIMVAEVLEHLRLTPGDVVVDATLGGGGHAQAILERIGPGGRLIAIDQDAFELPRTEARLRAAGYGAEVLRVRHGSFADLRARLDEEGVAAADAILLDLGVSAMQHDTPGRGFSYKHPGPLDLRMDPTRGEPASTLVGAIDEARLARVLIEYADEPHADLVAALVVRERPVTTHALERLVRLGLAAARPDLGKPDLKASVRRTFQALRILVNDELAALEAVLAALPSCLAPGGRVVVLTFHSGEDRRVKKAFREGRRAGVYEAIATRVVRSGKAETFTNRRAAAAKLRWAVRGPTGS